ncbi:MAG: hypothetical protein HUU46_18630 [Candidatus Hydrogenedentes bacterium]|nr:hypothetical protein [Candidatus Hydrogenedentota bacterium]
MQKNLGIFAGIDAEDKRFALNMDAAADEVAAKDDEVADWRMQINVKGELLCALQQVR